MIPFFQGAASGAPAPGTVFASTLYTGNGTSQTITSGINLSTPGGLVWIKQRTLFQDHNLYDTSRGVQLGLATNDTPGETNYAGTGLSAFGTTGFTVQNSGNINLNATTYVSWSFARAARFFDVVTWTGDGTSSQTINHSLGVTPGLIIAKRRDSTSQWFVWHRGSDVANSWTQLSLNATLGGAQANWSSRVSSTTFATEMVQEATLATTPNTNLATYVAYLFAHDTASDGIVQCGSFTTDGSGVATVTLGWEPQWLLTKSSTTTTNWRITDTTRGWSNGGTDYTLFPNLSNAEATDERGHPTSDGFYADMGSNLQTFIYCAIRKP